jgi:non-lysosomal glucosylceramidase
MEKFIYPSEELYSMGPQRSFSSDAGQAAFLLGGVGTGNVSIGARGELRDWEIFNSPGKGNYLPYSFFSIWAKQEGQKAVARVLEAKINQPYSKSHGFSSGEVAGLPRLESSILRGEYPFVRVDFEDEVLPVKVSLEAFTPFIPLNADDSGIPGAILRYRVKNSSDKEVDVTIAGSLANAVGFEGYETFGNMKLSGKTINEYRDDEGFRGLSFSNTGLSEHSLRYGSMALITGNKNVTFKPQWLQGGWWDGIQDFWDDFCEDGKLEVESVYNAVGSTIGGTNLKVGSLGINEMLKPGAEKVFEFILTWHFPNRVKDWEESCCCSGNCSARVERNYYSRLFVNAWAAGKYLMDNMNRLEKSSRDFHRALFSSTMPDYVLDAVSSNITVIRSTTCFRIEDGTLLGWEGCFDKKGCCEGSCTHVWNYAQTMAFLFPELEQSMRKVEFGLETDEEGSMAFRTKQVFGKERWNLIPAADGQLGTIIRLYREWKLSGEDELIKRLWTKASSALDFAFKYWDSDGDCVLDSKQHNTYDIEFYGPNSLTNTMFLAALKAAAEIGEYLGDTEHWLKYREAFEKGSKKMDELLWNGEYYVQRLEDVNKYRYQYGTGCLSDQVLGQMLAHTVGLGYILPKEHVKKAVEAIYKYNFRENFKEHNSVQRTYALNDEKGLLLCSWPHGGRPKLPFVYSDEVWTGIEYQVAAHLIYEGLLEEGLTIVKAVRERHDGYRRNPWDEVECGHHYARSMASWALLTALSGFKFDMVKGEMSFNPAINKENFSTFWSTGKSWGIYKQQKNPQTGELESVIEVLYGNLV